MTGHGADRLFAVLLAAYPRRFREVYAADMRRLFRERLEDARRDGCTGRFIWRTTVDMIVSGCAERFSRARPAHAIPPPTKGSRMTGLLQDLHYAARLLRRRPGFALFVVLTLGVGIGANTAAFTVVNAVLLRPLPFTEPEELVNVWSRFDPQSGFDFPQFPLSGPEFLDYQQHTRALEGIAAFTVGAVTVGGAGADPERAQASFSTPNLFELLGERPAFGRTFTSDEAKPDGPEVVVLSYGYWRSRFGADRRALGRSVPINGVPTQIIGVMPAAFAHPGPTTKMWIPLRLDPANPGGRSSHSLRAVARLADGVPLSSAQAELATLMQDWKVRFPEIHTGHYLFIRPTLDDAIGTIRPALLLLLSATGFVLLIVCANLASVVLARGEARTREMAIRGALGAERRRLIRLSLIESALLGLAGGLLGLALAEAGVRALIAVDPAAVPRSWEIGLDARVVLFAGSISMLSVVLFGLIPALRGSRADLQETLRDSSLSTTDSSKRQLFRRALVAVEVALSVTLAIGAALMLRSFVELTAVDPGFRPSGLVSARLALPLASYRDPARVEHFYVTLLERVQAAPGVTSASAGSTVPMLSGAGNWDFEVEGRVKPGPGQPAWNAKAVIVRPGYFETLGVPLVRGRFFTDRDDERAAPTVVINEVLANRFFAGEDPIGRRIRIAGADAPDPWMTVVGIAGDVRVDGLDEPAAPAYHFLQSQLPRTNGNTARALAVFARTNTDPSPVMASIRAAVRDLDPSLALTDIQTMDVVIGDSVARPRFVTWLLGLFAGVGLMLGASGIYGVLAYTVARRTREIGIRRALGAQRAAVARHVLSGGMVPVVIGLVAGLLLSFWTIGLWSSQLFGVSPADPVTYGYVGIVVLLVALAAMLLPVRRALRVSPLAALRAEQG